MSEPAAPPTESDPPLPHGNPNRRSHDELVREYVRNARERLAATAYTRPVSPRVSPRQPPPIATDVPPAQQDLSAGAMDRSASPSWPLRPSPTVERPSPTIERPPPTAEPPHIASMSREKPYHGDRGPRQMHAYPPRDYPQDYPVREPPRDFPPPGFPLQGHPPQGHPPRGYAPRGRPPRGGYSRGYPPRGYPPRDQHPRDRLPQGYAPPRDPRQPRPPPQHAHMPPPKQRPGPPRPLDLGDSVQRPPDSPQQPKSPSSPRWVTIPPQSPASRSPKSIYPTRPPPRNSSQQGPQEYRPPPNVHAYPTTEFDAPPPTAAPPASNPQPPPRASPSLQGGSHFSPVASSGPAVEPIIEESESQKSLRSAMSSGVDSDLLDIYTEETSAATPVVRITSHQPSPSEASIQDATPIAIAGQASMVQSMRPTLKQVGSSDRLQPIEPSSPADDRPDFWRRGTEDSSTSPPGGSPPSGSPLATTAASSKFNANSRTSSMTSATLLKKSPADATLKSPRSRESLRSQASHKSMSLLQTIQSRLRPNSVAVSERATTPTHGSPGGASDSPVSPRPGFGRRNTALGVVDEDEKRGSTTSLSGLIHRALRLASNLERGKTSSKFGTEWLNDALKEKGDRAASPTYFNEYGQAENARASGMLIANLPPSGLRQSTLMSSLDPSPAPRKGRRRCCGMPLWLFVLVIILLFLLVVAAVIIPVALIVIPDQDSSSSSTASSPSLAHCQKTVPCSNGGISVLGVAGACECLCSNGYTGKQCTNKDQTGCSTASFSGLPHATVGTAVVPILHNAASDFKVPLNASLILAMFSSSSLTCDAQNALVTFQGKMTRLLHARKRRAEGLSSPPPPLQTAAPLAFEYDDADTVADLRPRKHGVGTSHGIFFAQSTNRSPSATKVATTALITPAAHATVTVPHGSASTRYTYAPSASPGASSSAPGSFAPAGAATLDFARTAVLYVLQVSQNLLSAESAQSSLQSYFSNAFGPNAVSPRAVAVGGGLTVDLVDHTIVASNGAVVGGGRP